MTIPTKISGFSILLISLMDKLFQQNDHTILNTELHRVWRRVTRSYFINLLIPFFKEATLKLKSRPTLQPESFK